MNDLDIKAVNELKMLAIEMINHAGSGNPGICIDMAPVMYVLFTRVLNNIPQNPNFINKDRVILSSSNIAPLYYSMLHMAGFNITKEDLMRFRRCESNTPGLPEYGTTIGVDASTGFAGDGVGISAGIELGRRYYDNLIRKEDNKLNILNFTTYCFVADSDMMSGTSDEAFSFIANQKLSNLVFLYDSNNINSDGALNDVFEDNIEKKFTNLGFYVDTLKYDSSSRYLKNIEKSLLDAKKSNKPALIIFKNIIGKDSFNEGKNILHKGVLSYDDVSSLRRKYNIFLPQFEVSKDTTLVINKHLERLSSFYQKWMVSYNRLKEINNQNLNTIINTLENGNTLRFNSQNYKINDGYRESLMTSNYKVLNLIGARENLFLGGSSTGILESGTLINKGYLSSQEPLNKNIRFGVRESAMGNIINGLTLMNLKTFGCTDLCYLSSLLPSIKMSAIMNIPSIFIFNNDSVYNPFEGPARIPLNELNILRTIPNLITYRPGDIIELMGVWENILANNKPSALVISSNSIPKLPGSNALEVSNGAYIIKKEVNKLDGIIISSGSEVVSSMQIAYDLYNMGIDIRVVSVPSLELFETKGEEYIKKILPDNVKKIVIEAGITGSWTKYTTYENIIGIDDFAYSGLPIEVLRKMNFDYDSLKNKVIELLK